MASGFIVRLRPSGPWRLGPSSGARDRVDRVLHSDTLYSALTIAAGQLGFMADWLGATAQAAEPVVRVASAYPFVGRTLLAPAPKHVWPPASGRTRWKAARLVPLHVVPRLLAYESLKEDRWAVDPVSEAVLPIEKFGEVTPPFRVATRRTAAVDRVTGVSGEAASTACLEFAETAGMWCAVFCPAEWRDRVQSLFRFIADAGIGGERALGWGRSAAPEFDDLPSALTAPVSGATEHHEVGYWMLSLFAPAPTDRVDWSRGSYALVRRSGRTEDRGAIKPESAMVEEGSVIMADSMPSGFARDIAPEGSAHPVYRSGAGVAVPVPMRLPTFYERERALAAEAAAPPVTPESPVIPAVDSPPGPIVPERSTDIESESPVIAGIDSEPGPLVPEPSNDPAPESPVIPDVDSPPGSIVPERSTDIASESPVIADIDSEPGPLLPEPAGELEFAHPESPAIADTDSPLGPVIPEAPEPIEDTLAQPATQPESETFFVVETEPAPPPEQPADGGAFEDGPATPEADRDKPEDAQ